MRLFATAPLNATRSFGDVPHAVGSDRLRPRLVPIYQTRNYLSPPTYAIDERDLVRILRHPATMVGSDGGVRVFGQASPHPRSYGTFARVLGRYVREQGVITLEDAVRKMSALPAQRTPPQMSSMRMSSLPWSARTRSNSCATARSSV